MLDYSICDSDKVNFILYYTKDANNLIVNYADGSKKSFPFSKENEIKLLNVMKFQVQNCGKRKRFAYYDNKFCFGMTALWAMNIFFNAFGLFFGRDEGISYFHVVGLGASGWCFSRYFKKMSENGNLLLDMEKSEYTLENEEYLNRHFDRVSSLYKVRDTTKKVIESMPDEEEVFNINTVHGMSLSDLRRIKRNIDEKLSSGDQKMSLKQNKR